MEFPRFWARASAEAPSREGRTFRAACWRWSTRSLEDARDRARRAAEEVARRLAGGAGRLPRLEPPERYAYGARPLREEIVEEHRDGAGGLGAVVTRNAYGCLVLNTAQVMFVDVDLPAPPPPARGSWLARLRGRAPAPAGPSPVEGEALGRIEAWVRAERGMGLRVYRTRGGLRLLATTAGFDPADRATAAVMAALGADPKYVQLCRLQASFRARLSPKPWRCGVRLPPNRFPWESPREEQRYRDWERRYAAACTELATCALVTTWGDRDPHPDVAPILRLHDQATRAESGLPLA